MILPGVSLEAFLSCSVAVMIVRLEPEQFNPTLHHIADVLVDQFQCAQTDRDQQGSFLAA